MCLCSEINRLRSSWVNGEEVSHFELTPSIESSLEVHLETIYLLLSNSKRLSKNLPFSIKRKKAAAEVRRERTGAIFQRKFDHEIPREVFKMFKVDLGGFWSLQKNTWSPSDERKPSLLQDLVYSTLNICLRLDEAEAHQSLARRLNSIIVYLLSKLLPDRYDPRVIAKSFHNVSFFTNLSEEELQTDIRRFRDAGDRYMKIAFQLGGIGAVWCLPLEVARTAYVFHVGEVL